MAPKPHSSAIKAFQAQIWAYYGHSGRHNLPWRKTKNLYRIMISEVMLQQTQVSRVLEKYPDFLKIFPSVDTLASASLAEVLRVWQGMGYNRRAKYLRDAAQKITEEHKGRVPKNEQGLRTLPGVGSYTANAILTFALNEPRIFIETNIRGVFIHHFFANKKGVHDKELLSLIEQTLDIKNPREWYYALMDYGSHLPRTAKVNSNKHSVHYVKQSTFKGSLRELRGKIIRALSDKPKTLLILKRVCDNDSRTKDALNTLIKDKLVKYEKRKYQFA